MATTLTQICTAIADSTGLTQFQITSTVTAVAPGDLPSPAIFVFTIVDPANPKGDTFSHVADLVSLTTLTSSRMNAILLGQNNYLAAQFSVTYSDIVTAISAKQQIDARVDNLVSQWKSYSTQFVIPYLFTFPLSNSSILTTAQNNYATTKVAYATAQTNVIAAQTNVVSAQTSASTAQTNVNTLTTDVAVMQTFSTTINALASAESAFRSASNTFYSAGNSFYGANSGLGGLTGGATFSTALGVYATAQFAEVNNLQANLSTVVSYANAQYASKQASLYSAQSALTTANAAVVTAQTALSAAQSAATEASAALDAALVAVTTLDPTFTP